MIVNPTTIDAYLAKKGLVSQISDQEWESLLGHIERLLGRSVWHRCRLITQTDGTFDRYSTEFPRSVPRPYRHIRSLEIIASVSEGVLALQDWMNERRIRWETCSEYSEETEQIEVVGFRIISYG